MSTSSTPRQPTPLACILDPTLAPKPTDKGPSFNLSITNSQIGGVHIDAYHQRISPIPVDDQGRPTHTIDAVRPSYMSFCGLADDGVMVYPPACNDLPTTPDRDPDKYTFTPEEGRRLRMFAEQVCLPHDTCPERAGDFDRTAAFELAKMIHAKYQANVEIARILSR